MSDVPPKDWNDVVLQGGEIDLGAGTPIDPGTIEAPGSTPGAPGGAPPFEAPHPGEGGRDPDPGRTRILVTTKHFEVTAAAAAAVAHDGGIYVRGNALVRVIPTGSTRLGLEEDELDTELFLMRDPDAARIDILPKPILQERLTAHVHFVKLRRSKQKGEEGELIEVDVDPPGWCVEQVHARGVWEGFKHLEAVVEQPILLADGSVLDRAGFDRRSRILLDGRGFEAVPHRPTSDDVKHALEQIEDIVHDFAFEQPAHRSAWLASALTPLARFAFRGPAPLFLFDANVRGTGKGLAVEVAVRIATGRGPAVSTFTPDDAEMGKRIVTWASSGSRTVVLDDVEGKLGGGELRAVLTATTAEGRVLGLSQMWSGPALMTWFATANNAQLGREMDRRVCHVRLLSPVEDPSMRGGFRYPRLIEVVKQRQPALARAALTILRAYCVAGRPDQKLRPWGSYEEWTSLVRNAIVWAGWPDPNDTVDALRANADPMRALHKALVLGWATLLQRLNKDRVSTKEAVAYVYKGDPGPLPELRAVIDEIALEKDGRPSSRKLGYLMRDLRQKPWETENGGRLCVVDGGEDRNGTKRWRIAWLLEPRAADGGPAPPVASAGDAGHAEDTSVPSRARSPEGHLHGGVKEGSSASPASPAGASQSRLPIDPDDREPWDDDDR